DYRLFIRTLFTTDKPQLVLYFNKSNRGVLKKVPSFYNYLKDTKQINSCMDNLLGGIYFDVMQNGLWLKSWGRKPESPEKIHTRLRIMLKEAPRIIPVYGHRFLLIEPCRSDNPIFSIHQSDIICYGANFRRYLLTELADLIGIDSEKSYWASFKELRSPVEDIPFWGELYKNNMERR
ncbi:MAG: hypothetical protein KKH98_07075, partial [Spirochaetes bacterium]|nr:hypothetical protein [Spirochaetota bacterium]